MEVLPNDLAPEEIFLFEQKKDQLTNFPTLKVNCRQVENVFLKKKKKTGIRTGYDCYMALIFTETGSEI